LSDFFSIKFKDNFGDYLLTLLFVKHMFDHYKVEKKFSFENIVKLIGSPHIGLEMNMILSKLSGDNGLHGILDSIDFTDVSRLGDGKDMVNNISKMITSIKD
jgi:type I restriction enzyme M protein